MLKLLPPERPRLYGRVRINLILARLWLLGLVLTLLAFSGGLLPNGGLIFSLSSSAVLVGVTAQVLKKLRARWVEQQLNEYERAYREYASQRVR